MAQFKMYGQTYSASREVWKLTVPKRTTFDLESVLCNLGRVEIAYNRGEVDCSEADWDELAGIAADITNELCFRHLFSECGITLEVR